MHQLSFRFRHTDTYINFLLNNHLKEVIDYGFSKAREEKLPIMNLLPDKSEESLYLLWKENFINNFLHYLIQDMPQTGFIQRIDKWKADQILVPREQVQIEDILSISYIRKLTLLEFIPLYTKEIAVALAIVKEIESFFKAIEQYALQAYDEINRSKLEDKEKVLNGLLANLPVIVTRMDTHGNILESAGAGLKELKLDENYLKGKNVFDLYPDAANVERVIRERIFLSFEDTAGADTNLRYFQNYFFPEGNQILGFSIDITDRKKTEQALQETQHYISQVAHTSPDTLYIYHLTENKIVYLNRDTAETLGYSTEEIYQLGADIMNALFHPEDVDKVKQHFREFSTAQDKEVREIEFRIRNKEWKWRHILTRETVFKRTPEGTPYEIIGILRDITDKKEAEEEIRYTTRLLEKLLYNFPISIGRIDLDGTFLESRGLGVRKFGSYDNQIAGWHVENFPPLIEPVQKILSGESIEFIGYTDFKGRTIYFKNYGFFDPEKKCAIILAVEITEMKEAEERLKKLNDELELKVLERTKELQASEEGLRQTLEHTIQLNNKIAASENFLSSIIDQSPISTWIADADGTMIRVNQACLDLFGVQHAEAGIGKYNLFQDNSLQQSSFFEDIKAVFTEGKVAKFSIDYNLSQVSHVNIPTGVPISVVTTIFPIKDENGRVINAVVQHEDVTQRKQALEALQKSEEQLRLITDSLPVLITYIDNNERYQFNNKTYEEWFNIPRKKVYGLAIKDVIGEAAYAKLKDSIQKALRGEQVYFEGEIAYKEAGVRYVSVNYIPRFERNKVIGYYALITDISERKRAEEAIEKALQETEAKNKELIKINQLLDNFVYMAAHDLKSPVSNIKVLVSMLSKETNPAEKPELLAAINESINRLDNTIEGLVEVIEIQSVNNIPTKPIYFEHILRQIMADAGRDLEKCNGQIIADFKRCPSVVYIEPFLLSIMRNLVTNAIKYHSASRNPEIRISSRQEAEFVVLTVADNGIGMDLNRYGQHLFKPFTRFTNQAKGKGLGLHLVKTMVEKNGGLISLESKPDAGTTFNVFLKEY